MDASMAMTSHFQVEKITKYRAIAITDKSICSIFKKHRDPTLNHLPQQTRPNVHCGIHKWVGLDTEKNHYCNINLCMQCYSGFLMTKKFISDKNKLKLRYNTYK